jgi:hypothetical protein
MNAMINMMRRDKPDGPTRIVKIIRDIYWASHLSFFFVTTTIELDLESSILFSFVPERERQRGRDLVAGQGAKGGLVRPLLT